MLIQIVPSVHAKVVSQLSIRDSPNFSSPAVMQNIAVLQSNYCPIRAAGRNSTSEVVAIVMFMNYDASCGTAGFGGGRFDGVN